MTKNEFEDLLRAGERVIEARIEALAESTKIWPVPPARRSMERDIHRFLDACNLVSKRLEDLILWLDSGAKDQVLRQRTKPGRLRIPRERTGRTLSECPRGVPGNGTPPASDPS